MDILMRVCTCINAWMFFSPAILLRLFPCPRFHLPLSHPVVVPQHILTQIPPYHSSPSPFFRLNKVHRGFVFLFLRVNVRQRSIIIFSLSSFHFFPTYPNAVTGRLSLDSTIHICMIQKISPGTPIFSIRLINTTYISCICRPHQYAWNIRDISMDLSWISNVVAIHGISMDIPCISTKYIRGISMSIHGISFDVYTWYIRCISMHIPSFLFPDFSAGPCCWSHSMRTRVLVIKSGLLHAPPWQLC